MLKAGTIPRSYTVADYALVAASQTLAPLSATGAIGNLLASVTILPAAAAAGVVTLFDGTGSDKVSIPLFVGGGTTALTDLKPLTVPLNALATKAGGWAITTGANVSVIATGIFT